MLKNLGLPSYKNGDIVTVVTPAGQEVICKYIDEDVNNYYLEQPLALQPNQSGQISFVPPVFSGDEVPTCTFHRSNAMWITPTNADAVAAYQTAVSGIVTPTKQKIIT